MNNELSYEEEQLQILLLREMNQHKILQERILKQEQDEEYLKSMREDEIKNKVELIPEEISIVEMRRIRLKRFSKYI